ncbi:CppA N-terminal domain-containing protein [Lactococcus termiticola]|uniref:Proteinase n=1 Tax=Lactococcus termiticola TaxID=2169526 RepID=A0A2R5HEQ1_9LACT|nr:CppA N-terminal domain-containing protein [Lactococcus termiticola]GBG96529.1 hypothetical protein NtB2_00642 [Lactococcus termiticola]
MQKLLDQLKASVPAYRVHDREENLTFYREVLGFKVLLEEGACCYLGGQKTKAKRLIIEESPEARVVKGLKKHARTVVLADAEEIAGLLARNIEAVDKVYSQGKHWAFEALSPENDRFLVLSDKDLSSLKELDKDQLKLEAGKADEPVFLSDFEILEIELNVADDQVKTAFDSLCGEKWQHPAFSFSQATGEDLTADTEEVLDIEFLLFEVEKDLDLAEVKASLPASLEASLDKAEKTLLLTIPGSIDVWLVKSS